MDDFSIQDNWISKYFRVNSCMLSGKTAISAARAPHNGNIPSDIELLNKEAKAQRRPNALGKSRSIFQNLE